MERMFNLILATSLYASIVGISIIIFKALLKDKISPKWHYLLWIILAIKLVIPFGPESTISIFNKVPPITTRGSITQYVNEASGTADESISIKQNEKVLNKEINIDISQSTLNNSHKKQSINFYLSYIWVLGAMLMACWLLYTNYSLYLKLKKYKDRVEVRVYIIFEEAKRKVSIKRNIQVVFQSIVNTPALFGMFKPKILLPTEALNLNDKEISYILLHELAHYKRKDILANYILLIFQILHWFNPIIWFCFRKIREDMELATDEKVLNILGESEHKDYGKALLKVLESLSTTRLSPKLIGMVDNKKNMERRIRMIKMSNFFTSKRRIVFVIGTLCITIMAAIFLTSGKTTEEEVLLTNEEVVLNEKTPTITSYEEIFKYKTPYVGDNVKVASLLDNLLYRELKKGISLETNNKPYGVTVNYDFTNVYANTEEIKANLKINSIVLFTLIDNVDFVSFNIEGMAAKENYMFTRNEIQNEFNKDLREYGRDLNQFQIFMNSLAFKVVVSPEKYALTMSSTIGIKLQPGFIGEAKTVRYSTSKGKFAISGNDNISGSVENGKMVILSYGTPVYWIPLLTEGIGKEGERSIVGIDVYNENGKIIAEKKINIEFKNGFYTVVPSEGIIIGGKSQARIANPKIIDEAVHNAILGRASSYKDGEVATEGHVILESEEKDGTIKVFVVASYSAYGFENGIFTGVSGSGAIPTVITFERNEDNEYILKEYKEPMDGAGYISSIKDMFPKKLWDTVLKSGDFPEIRRQQEEQASKYLESIGRKAEISSKHVEKQLSTINVEASNKLFSEFTKYDAELNRFPYWIGTREEIQDGVRYIYKTSQSKTADGYDLITFTKKKEDGTVVKEYKYKIVGSEPQLIE